MVASIPGPVYPGDDPAIGAMLTESLGGPEAPAAIASISRGFVQPPGAMKDKEVQAKRMKVRVSEET